MKRARHLSTGWATAAWLLVGAAALGQTPVRPDPSDATEIVQRELQTLAARLNAPGIRQDERDEAARRLISRRNPDARRVVADALVNLQNPEGQIAAARALAEDPNPDPAMINPLFAALGTNRALTEAAARTLSTYKNQPEVLTRLIDYAQKRPPQESARLAVIRAIGSIPEKRSAEFLINLLRAPDESTAVRRTAAEALVDLSGRPDVGDDPARWAQWWEINGTKSDSEFRADLVTRRAARYDQTRLHLHQLHAEVDALLKEQYRVMPTAQRPELLLRLLRSGDPHVRAVGAAIVYEDALEARVPAPVILEQLRGMVGDSSPVVRTAVAETLGRLNDAGAFEALLAQLAQEPEAQVRTALAQALGPMGDLRAAPVLLGMLSDPSQTAAASAADALKQLGPLMRQQDPGLARRAARALLSTLETRTGTPATARFREALISAMVPLRQEELLPVLTRMLDERRGETPEARRLAISAIGEIADPRSAGVLEATLTDPNHLIRLEAVQALAKNPALAENAEVLRRLLDEREEPDENVRLAAWRALETVFPSLPKAQLAMWADRFRNDPQRRLIVLKALAQQQLRDKDEDDLASTRQNMAAAYMELNQYSDAEKFYGMALDYYLDHRRTGPVAGAVIDSLMRERMKALLLSRDYAAAVEFAEKMIARDPGSVQLMGTLIWNEAQQLRQQMELQPALDLIAAAGRMNPPLPQRYREDLAKIEQDIQQRQTQQNNLPDTASLRSAATTRPAPAPTAAAQ